jgi:hypothetical protein
MDLLQTGLDEIVAIVGPNGAESWNTVGADSERLLKVWVAKESDDPAALEVAQQLTDILWELSADSSAPASPLTPPRLVIKEPAPPVNTPALPQVADTIRHVQPFSLSTPVATVEIKEVTVVEEASVIESDEEESVKQIDEASVAASEEEEEEEAASVADEEVEEEDEVLEPPADAEEEEEEEGMSVEQITIRGRTYWRDTDTDDLYAVVGEDDVGDKVGQIVNGVARFLPLKK